MNTNNSFIGSHTNWYDTGEIRQNIDPLGNTTTHSYDVVYAGAYSTLTTNALNQSVSGTYDYNTGLLTSYTNANAVTPASGGNPGDPAHTSTYTYDFMSRLTSATLPEDPFGNHPQTTFNYPDATTVERLKKIIATLTDDSFTYADGLGRDIRSQHVTPGGNVYVDTTYDGLNRAAVVTNPYFFTNDPTYGITQSQYDGLGRLVQVALPDGTTPTPGSACLPNNACTQYTDNIVTTTDQAGKQRRTITDGLGRLVEVDEPNPGAVATAATGWVSLGGSEQFINGTVTVAVASAGFETPALGSGGYQYHPTGSNWSFSANNGFDGSGAIVGGAGLTANNSGFTSANPAAPEGGQVAFLQGGSANFLAQSISGFQAGVSYTISFQAAQRGS